MTSQVQAKLDGGDWQLPLSPSETSAVLENVAAVLKVCEALGIEAVLIGPQFVIRVPDVLVERAPSGIWAAFDPVGLKLHYPLSSSRSCGNLDQRLGAVAARITLDEPQEILPADLRAGTTIPQRRETTALQSLREHTQSGAVPQQHFRPHPIAGDNRIRPLS